MTKAEGGFGKSQQLHRSSHPLWYHPHISYLYHATRPWSYQLAPGTPVRSRQVGGWIAKTISDEGAFGSFPRARGIQAHAGTEEGGGAGPGEWRRGEWGSLPHTHGRLHPRMLATGLYSHDS